MKSWLDSFYIRFRRHEERLLGSAMSSGSSGDADRNYIVRISKSMERQKVVDQKTKLGKRPTLPHTHNPST